LFEKVKIKRNNGTFKLAKLVGRRPAERDLIIAVTRDLVTLSRQYIISKIR